MNWTPSFSVRAALAAAAPIALAIAVAAILHASSAAAGNFTAAERRVEQGIRTVTAGYQAGIGLEEAALQPPASHSVLVLVDREVRGSVGALAQVPAALPEGELAAMTLPGHGRFVGFMSPPEPPENIVVVLGEPAPSTEAVLRSNALRYLGIGLLGLLTAASLVGLAVKRALRRVDSLREQVSGITVDRAVSPVDVPAGNDELTRLGLTLNAMVERIGRSAAQLEGFASDTAHELRNPLAAIRVNLEAARRTSLPEDRRAAMDRALTEVDRCGRLVDSLLVVATLDRDVPSDSVQKHCSAAVVTMDVIELAEASHPAISFDTTEVAEAEATIDSTHLAIALANLIDNAGRHANSVVRVAVADAGPNVEIVVEDDGAGVPRASRDLIFERFRTGDDARHFGLGLPLARRLIEGAAGTLTAVEPRELPGACFLVSLPRFEANGAAPVSQLGEAD